MLSVGDEIDRYIVEDVIGEGGMARVYRVRHKTLEALFALKVLTITAPGVRDRLVAEGKVQSQLNHPNVLRVLDVLDVNGTPGLLMDYVDGPELGVWIEDTKPSLEEALRVFDGVAAGVRAAHEAGLVHRDLKPGNVLIATGIDGEPIPKVSDFGLVKAVAGETLRKGATRAGLPMGTPAYMPPEQIRDASSVDGRADVFALGCILYELLAGHPAFEGEDPIDIFDKVRAGDHGPMPATASPAVAATILACLATDRDQRLPSVQAVQASLTTESPLPPAPKTQATITPALIGGVAAIAALGLVGGIGGFLGLMSLLTAVSTPVCEAPSGGWVQLAGGGLPRDGQRWVARADAPLHETENGRAHCTLPRGTRATITEVAEPLDPRDPWVQLSAKGMELAGPDAPAPEGLAVCFGQVSGWAASFSMLTRPKKGTTTWTVRPTQPLLSGRPTEANGWSKEHTARCELAHGSIVTFEGDVEAVRNMGTWMHVRSVE